MITLKDIKATIHKKIPFDHLTPTYTVREMREMLEGMPDDAEFIIANYRENHLVYISSIEYPEERP